VLEDRFLFLRGFWIENNDRCFIAAQVRRCVDLLVVVGEEQRIQGFLEVGLDDLFELARFVSAVEQSRIDAIRGCDHAQLAVVVGNVAAVVARVFDQEFQLSGIHIDAIGIEEALVALVDRNEHVLGIVLEVIDHTHAHFIKGRQIFRILPVCIHGIEAKVLVTTGVLDENDPAVAGPGEPGDVPFLCTGHPDCFLGAHFLNVNIHPVFPRLHEREMRAVGGKIVARRFRIAEEVPHWNQRENGGGITQFHPPHIPEIQGTSIEISRYHPCLSMRKQKGGLCSAQRRRIIEPKS
jgi:hypothetical protein